MGFYRKLLVNTSKSVLWESLGFGAEDGWKMSWEVNRRWKEESKSTTTEKVLVEDT